ncbi:MAG TPA: ArsR family transcriptional regulator [Desulfobacterales bacterium]|nr:ArsR family transcriptional regulator [Desulfobacterales bacterium]
MSHKSFSALQAESIRLTILQLLAQDPGYDLNETILRKLINEFGYQLSKDGLRTHLAWLMEQGLVTVRTVADYLQVAKLTQRGFDTANGQAIIPGVARPGPEA